MTSAAAGEEAAVIARALRKAFAGGVVALAGVDLRIEHGTLTAVVGENGSGKSTLLELIAGLARPSSGEISVLAPERMGSKSLRRRIGYASQAPALDPEMTGAEMLELFAALYGISATEHEVEELVADFNLQQHIGRKVATYSGGMRQRLHLALAFQHRPDLLLLDEPTTALDPAGRAWFWTRVQSERSRGRTIVMVTHDLAEVAQHCNRIALLQDGRLLADAAPEQVVAEHASFLLELEVLGGEAVPEELGAVPGIERVTRHPGRAVVDLGRVDQASALDAKERILHFLVERRIGATAFRLRAPDLASAYFNLTGRDLKAGANAARAGARAGQRRQGAAVP